MMNLGFFLRFFCKPGPRHISSRCPAADAGDVGVDV